DGAHGDEPDPQDEVHGHGGQEGTCPDAAGQADGDAQGATSRRRVGFGSNEAFHDGPKGAILSPIPCTLRSSMESAAPAEDAAPAARPGEGLRVLTITNLYPTPGSPAYGSFIASQVESLRAAGVATDVDFIDGRRSKWEYLRALPRIRR